MTGPAARSPRRPDALSRERIVAAAIEILDADGGGGGAEGLTVRALSSRLSTGRGAIYHHVSSMDELLAAAADHVIAPVTEAASLRDLALGIFDAIDAHPWVGAQLVREPMQPAVLRIWTSVGRRLRDLGVPAEARPDAGAALVNYVLGATAQYAAGARRSTNEAARKQYLDELATAWTKQDPDAHEATANLRDHDDRVQFLAGVDIFLRGL